MYATTQFAQSLQASASAAFEPRNRRWNADVRVIESPEMLGCVGFGGSSAGSRKTNSTRPLRSFRTGSAHRGTSGQGSPDPASGQAFPDSRGPVGTPGRTNHTRGIAKAVVVF